MSQLLPCSSCSRHVLVSESQCPFCSSSLKLEASNRPRVPQGLRRAQLFALGASLAAVACGEHEEPQVDAVPIYGATATPGESAGMTSTASSGDVEPGASTEDQHSGTGGSTSEDSNGSNESAPTGDGSHADTGPVNTGNPQDAGAGDAGSDGGESTDDGSRGDWTTSPGAQPVYGAVPIDVTWER